MLMTPIHAKRLLKLANKLETFPRKQFNLRYWKKTKECGTVACACGVACTIPSFRKLGLGLKDVGFGDFKLMFKPTTKASRTEARTTFRDAYGYDPWDDGLFLSFGAAEVFFGLRGVEANDLFDYDSYPRGDKTTPKQVAKRIREVVKKYHPDLAKADRRKRLAAA